MSNRLQDLVADQLRRCQAGDLMLVEAYLAEHPDLAAEPDSILELLVREFRLRLQLGEDPTPDEYLCRFPHLADRLQRQLDLHQLIGSHPQASSEATTSSLSAVANSPGPRGPGMLPTPPGYEILGELGRGGMGVVYQARQVGLKRLVALKMILAGAHATSEQRARFRTEAEAAARLHHPHIVQIHEIGEHDGLPYFSMEYVQGGSLARRLGSTPQPPESAAELVAALAQAIHYAHQQGIVHRDLKPANILLQRLATDEHRSAQIKPDDSHGSLPRCVHLCSSVANSLPKISDFGLAKQLDETAQQTRSGQVLGTPSYMAPEQASGHGHSVGPATDVYALGAILYELLTGRPPFKAITAAETVLQVLHQEPVPPRQLQPLVPRDLEIICLKCLEKEPARRFGSALALAEDLRRFQQGEPIHARPTPLWERGWKWARRRPAVTALGSASCLALLVLLGMWVSFTRQLQNEKARAEQKRTEAVRDYRLARAAVDRFLSEMADDDDLVQEGLDGTRRRLLESALEFYQQFVTGNRDDPELKPDLADAHYRLATIHRRAFSIEEAQNHHRRARELYARLAEDFPEVAEYKGRLAGVLASVALVHRQKGQLADAEEFSLRALTLLEELHRHDPASVTYRGGLGACYLGLAWVYLDGKQWEKGEATYKQGRDVLEQLLQEGKARRGHRHHLGNIYHQLGNLYERSKQFDKVEPVVRRGLAIRQALVEEFPESHTDQVSFTLSLIKLGELHEKAGRLVEAEECYQRAVAIREHIAQVRPTFIRNLVFFASGLRRLAGLCERTGRGGQVLPLLHKALVVNEKLMAIQPAVRDHQLGMRSAIRALVAHQRNTGLGKQCEPTLRRVLASHEAMPSELHSDTHFAYHLATLRTILAEQLLLQRQHTEALTLFEEALRDLEPAVQQEDADARSLARTILGRRGEQYLELGQNREALAEFEQGLRLDRGRERERLLVKRALTLALLKQHGRAVQEAVALAKAKLSAEECFDLGRVYGLAADSGNNEEYAAQAVHWFSQAQAAGFFKGPEQAAHLASLPELAALVPRPDFKALHERIQQTLTVVPGVGQK